MRTRTMFALSAVAVLGLSACGGGSSEPLTQEQTTQALLTDEDFPLDGFTAGPVEEGMSDDDGAAGDVLEDFPGGDQLSEECVEALGAINTLDADFSAQSTVEFTGEDSGASLFGPSTLQLTVASLEEGDNPLDMIHGLNDACEEVTVEEEGFTMTMSFNEIDGAQGTKITMDVMGQSIDVAVVGREDGGNYSVVMAMGISDEEIIQVLDAQEDKVANL